LSNDPLGKKKSGDEFFIVSRGPHGRCHGCAADPDFERLFDRYLIRDTFMVAVVFSAEDAAGPDSLRFRVRQVHDA
jgi:hypothetical protein